MASISELLNSIFSKLNKLLSSKNESPVLIINEFNLNILNDFGLDERDVNVINNFFATKELNMRILEFTGKHKNFVMTNKEYLYSTLAKFTYYICQNNFYDVDLSLSALINKYVNSSMDTYKIIKILNFVPCSKFNDLTILQIFIQNRNWCEIKTLSDFFLDFVIECDKTVRWRNIDKSYIMLFEAIYKNKFQNDVDAVVQEDIFIDFELIDL